MAQNYSLRLVKLWVSANQAVNVDYSPMLHLRLFFPVPFIFLSRPSFLLSYHFSFLSFSSFFLFRLVFRITRIPRILAVVGRIQVIMLVATASSTPAASQVGSSQPLLNRQGTRTLSSHPSHSYNVPLSARRSAPLDMSTVEWRGREPAKRVHPRGIPEAPTFYPTEEEFKDPTKYISKIAPEGKKYGICKIIPPKNWRPPFAIDTEVSYSSAF